MRTAQSDDRSGARFSATSRQEGGANPPTPVRCDTCGVAGCGGECGALAGERERRADLRAGWLIVAVGLAALLCPGCGEAGDSDVWKAQMLTAFLVLFVLAVLFRAGAAAGRATRRQPEFLEVRRGVYERPSDVESALERPGGRLLLRIAGRAADDDVLVDTEFAPAWRKRLGLPERAEVRP